MFKKGKLPIKESYLLIIIIVGVLSLSMYSSFALFSLEKTTSNDIVTMRAASDIETTLKIFEYKKITVSAGDNTSVMVNVNNDTGGSIYYGVFYEMVSPNTKTDDIGIYKIDWSANATSGSITNGSKLPVEIIIINNSSSDITLNIGVAGSDSNELGLPDGKTLITETFNTGTEPSGDEGTTKTTTTNYSYTGSVQTATLKAGTHKLEVWGAQGGGKQNDSSLDTANGGMGGYSYGTLTLTSNANVFIYVGGMGKSIGSGLAEGGFNGGGAAYGSSTGEPANGGGGASDIRINEDSLYSRVIVAGGGGGGGEDSGDNPGYGGGTSGGASSGMSTLATQTSTGTGGVFGFGANTPNDGGGGGGGWYGGGTTNGSQNIPTSNSGSDTSGGAGGSGYVYTSSTASNYPTGVKLNSSYYLTNAATIAGNTSFTDNSGSTVTGHSGNGYARITSTVKASTAPSIDTSSVTLKPDPVTNLKDIVTCKDNGSGCKIVLVSPISTKNMKENTTTTVVYVLENNAGKRYKYKKQIEIRNNILLTSLVKSLNDDGASVTGSGVYKINHSSISSNNSSTGGTIPANTEYRYYGAKPNNYICLDMEGGSTCPDKHLYRIIGSIYEEKENTNRIKVIKATSLKDANNTDGFSWDYTSSGSYSNIWATPTNGNYSNSLTSGSQLMKLLNSGAWWNNTIGNYYNNNSTTSKSINFKNYGLSDIAKSFVFLSRYYLGGATSYEMLSNDFYVNERGTARYDTSRPLYWDGYVGLIYYSDYGYASGKECSENTVLNSYGNSCYNNNWILIGNSYTDYRFVITPFSNSSINVFTIRTPADYAIISNAKVYQSWPVYPSFYLTSSTLITGGTGTESDPYLISK